MADRHMKTYLGDGAYGYVADYRSIVLYTSDGINETNRVEIGVGDIEQFVAWVQKAAELARSA